MDKSTLQIIKDVSTTYSQNDVELLLVISIGFDRAAQILYEVDNKKAGDRLSLAASYIKEKMDERYLNE